MKKTKKRSLVRPVLALHRNLLLIPFVRLSRYLASPASYSDPLRVVWVNPFDVNFVAAIKGKASKYARVFRSNSLLDGDWDYKASNLNRNDLFQMCEKRFHDGLAWEEIPEYRKVARLIQSGQRRLKCGTLEELRRAVRKLDAMAADIKENGFRTQKQLGTGRIWDEIRLAVSREGELLFINGRHRLAIARALRLPKVPAIISMTHVRFEGKTALSAPLMVSSEVEVPAAVRDDRPGAWSRERAPAGGEYPTEVSR